MFEYESMRRIQYGEGVIFVPVCSKCGRFVKADKTIFINGMEGLKDVPNCTCTRCGRSKMIFEGFI